jgi:hypothetical protein
MTLSTNALSDNVCPINDDVVVVSSTRPQAEAMWMALTYLICTTEQRESRMRTVSQSNPEIFGTESSELLKALVGARKNIESVLGKR